MHVTSEARCPPIKNGATRALAGPTPRRRRPPQVVRVLAIPGFARLLASQALFDIGAVARTAAQSWVMYDLTGSNLWVGLVSGIRALPILVLPIFTTNETALITSAIASCTLPIIAYIASPAFRKA